MAYTTVLFDLDHTLLDSDASEAAAYELTLRAAGCDDPAAHFSAYRRINGALWAQVEQGLLSPNEVKTRRFAELTAEIGLDADVEMMAANFVNGLGQNGELYPGAREMLDSIAATAVLGLVTNGIGAVQRARLERLDIGDYFGAGVAISGELGVSKPAPEIFDVVFASLGEPDRASALMVGDSLSSDIAGSHAAGIDSAWFNPTGAPPVGPEATHEISSLTELIAIAQGRAA